MRRYFGTDAVSDSEDEISMEFDPTAIDRVHTTPESGMMGEATHHDAHDVDNQTDPDGELTLDPTVGDTAAPSEHDARDINKHTHTEGELESDMTAIGMDIGVGADAQLDSQDSTGTQVDPVDNATVEVCEAKPDAHDTDDNDDDDKRTDSEDVTTTLS